MEELKKLKEENAFLRKHLGTWKKLYDRLCAENTRLEGKNTELYKRIHELENNGTG